MLWVGYLLGFGTKTTRLNLFLKDLKKSPRMTEAVFDLTGILTLTEIGLSFPQQIKKEVNSFDNCKTSAGQSIAEKRGPRRT